MQLFQQAFISGTYLGGCRYFPPGEKEAAYNELVLLMGRAEKELKLVTGELNPEFYERGWLINIWEELLDKGVRISAVFSDQAIRELGKGPDFRESHGQISALKEVHPSNIRLYCAPERPMAHYAVADGKHVFFEDEHGPHEGRNAFFEYDSMDFASQLSGMFDQLVSALSEREILV